MSAPAKLNGILLYCLYLSIHSYILLYVPQKNTVKISMYLLIRSNLWNTMIKWKVGFIQIYTYHIYLSEKAGFKLNIQKTKIMVSGPIISWQIDREKIKTIADFISLSSKITVDGDCSHEIKRRLLLGRKVMINLNNVLKSKDITLPTKVCIVKAMFVCFFQ